MSPELKMIWNYLRQEFASPETAMGPLVLGPIFQFNGQYCDEKNFPTVFHISNVAITQFAFKESNGHHYKRKINTTQQSYHEDTENCLETMNA
jgi:hypothetical protein